MVEGVFFHTHPTPTHQQRSQAHSADSPKYQGGEKMQNVSNKIMRFQRENQIHRLVWFYLVAGVMR